MCKILNWQDFNSPYLISLQYCFEIYSADNSSGLIKACKTDSEGKVVEGLYEWIKQQILYDVILRMFTLLSSFQIGYPAMR